MPYGGVPTAREIITQKLADGSLAALYDAADTDDSVRRALGISESVWHRLRGEIREFGNLSTRSRKQKFLEIKEALMKNARGFTYEETTEEIVIDPDTGEEIVKRKTREKKYKNPDYNSARVIMANIKSAEKNQANPDPEIVAWTNRPEEALEIKTEGGISLTLDASVQSVLEALSGN